MKVFIEAGGNDGIFQSRSIRHAEDPEYFGILIEPIPHVYDACVINRANDRCKVFNYALVPFSHKDKYVVLNLHRESTAMAAVNKPNTVDYNNSISVPAITLTKLLLDNNITKVDIFYLDVEGYEPEVLQGIDFDKIYIENIEVECHYSLTGIGELEEINWHKDFLNQYNYEFIGTNYSDGLPKLIFRKKQNV